MSRIADAFAMALELHDDQTRKGTDVPYITHLMIVAGQVGEAGGDEDEIIAALLHDAAEDQGGEATLDEIRRRFGARVADIVEGCSDTFETPKPPWRARKEAYLAHLREAGPSVHLVSAADKLHNARSIVADMATIGDAIWDRFSATREQTIWYYETLLATYRACGHAPERLLRPLARAVAAMAAE